LYAGAAQCVGGTLVGNVVVTFTAEGKVTVKYNMYPVYILDATHIYVGYTPYPLLDGKFTVSPGQYKFDAEAVFTAPFYVIAHAVVCGSFTKSAPVQVVTGGISDLKVYPNPFDRMVTFEFISDRDARAILDIYNLTGQKITTLMNKTIKEGVLNRVDYRPLDQANGIFFYRLNLDGVISTGKLLYNRR